jgi:hypothetical protein
VKIHHPGPGNIPIFRLSHNSVVCRGKPELAPQREGTECPGRFRFDNVENKSILAPRVNASFDIIPKSFPCGLVTGSPPKPDGTLSSSGNAYFDFVHFNN